MRRILAAAAAIVTVAVLVPAFGSPAGAPASSITFASHVVVDPVHTFGEPDVKVAPDGTVYVSGPWGTGTQRSIWEVSPDGGRSFRPLHDVPALSPLTSTTNVTGPGGGDTEISIDHNGKVYYSDLAALTSLKMATWDPSSRQMKSSTFVKGEDNFNGYDRQWFALWDPPDEKASRAASGYTGPLPVNYLQYNEALLSGDCESGGCSAVSYSTDGITYPDVTGAHEVECDGNVVVDQTSGRMVQAICLPGNSVGIGVWSRDPSKPGDPALRTMKEIKAATLPEDVETGGGVPFPIVAIDNVGTVYLVWATTGDPVSENAAAWQISYASASAASGWTDWSEPVRLSTPPARTNTMPWAVAGARGRLAVVWYGTQDTSDPSGNDAHQAWDVYLASVTAADTSAPVVEQTKVTRHPMHYGTICMSGVGCALEQGNRNLADFFQVTFDPRDGAILIVYDDTSNELTQQVPGTQAGIPPPADGIVDHRGAPVVMLARQNGGVGLLGREIGGDAAVAAALGGRAGDARFDPIYGTVAVPQLDLTDLALTADGDDLVIDVTVSSLEDAASALPATGAGSLEYVVRWTGAAVDAPTGTQNPIYFAAAEVTAATTSFFAGRARSIDLCSVSACTPHMIDYPAPPVGASTVEGELVAGGSGAPDRWRIRVPRSLVGNPGDDAPLESFSAFAIARATPAGIPRTNAEALAGSSPVVVDAICCTDATVAASRTQAPEKARAPAGKPSVVKGARHLPATGVPDLTALSLALMATAAGLARRLRA